MLHRRHKHDIIVIFAVLSLAISVYLAVTKFLGIAIPCSITHGCAEVLSSKYSVILGVPLPVLGIVSFSLIIILALLANHYNRARKILTIFLGLASLGALGFLSIQFFVLKKVCEYCLTTDSLTILMFLWDLNIDHLSFSEKN